eukprot:gene53766-73540_t
MVTRICDATGDTLLIPDRNVGSKELRRKIYMKAKAEKTHRFWGLYVHVCKTSTLTESYQMAKRNNGAPGIDGMTFDDIEKAGVAGFLRNIQEQL